jgi:hypothetical protein
MKCEVEQNTHGHDYLFNVTTGEALLDVSSELPDHVSDCFAAG